MILINMKEAFLLNNYIRLDNQFHLIGRVLSDIRIEHILLYKEGNTERRYVIKRIIAYRRDFDIIYEGMTCELIVEGDLCDFAEDSILYKLNTEVYC